MSEPIPRFRTLTHEEHKEFDGKKVIRPSLVKCDDGNLVAYSDYAALKAKVERLTSKRTLSDDPTWQAIGAYAYAKEENDRLRAEVERLQKLVGMQNDIDACIDAWIESKKSAAKEGRDAK